MPFFFIALRCVPRCKDFFITARTVPPVDHTDTQSKCFLGAGCSRRGKVKQHRTQRTVSYTHLTLPTILLV